MDKTSRPLTLKLTPTSPTLPTTTPTPTTMRAVLALAILVAFLALAEGQSRFRLTRRFRPRPPRGPLPPPYTPPGCQALGYNGCSPWQTSDLRIDRYYRMYYLCCPLPFGRRRFASRRGRQSGVRVAT